MKITIAGTGYVGIVTGVGFANLGNDVVCLDIDKSKLDKLSKGELTIYEPGLDEIFKRNLAGGRITFTDDAKKAVEASDIIMVCVGTPPNEKDEADLTFVEAVAKDVGRYMNGYKVIVNKSTVPVGTAELVRSIIKDNQEEAIPFDVVSNPEFLREGAAVKDFENPDRIIIGTDSEKAEGIMTSLYRSVARTDRPIIVTSIKSAEIIKYAGNTMLATRISFMNQLSHLCEKTGADIKDVARGLGLDRRIGSRFLHAGIGFGGSCFPKDVKALISTLKQHGCDADLFEAVHRINETQKTIVNERLESALEVKGSMVAIWGLSFKPKTDDIREASSLKIIEALQKQGAVVNAYDPIAMDNARAELGESVAFAADVQSCAKDAQALVLMTEWPQIVGTDWEGVVQVMKAPTILFDGRNSLVPGQMSRLGFDYVGVGRR
ncbi:MAG: UDP-glucose/GDP-mannose dehydrogenase family protein, partial [Desulfobacterales bacterium]